MAPALEPLPLVGGEREPRVKAGGGAEVGVFGREEHQVPGKSSQNKHLERKSLTFLASTSPLNAERRHFSFQPERRKDGGGRGRPCWGRKGFSGLRQPQVRASGKTLQGPEERA